MCLRFFKISALKLLDRAVCSKTLKLYSYLQMKTNARSVHFYMEVKDGLKLTKV
jgi:hypothetical protein